jgi:polypeptide N-acetylgalactosaminyltransferase
MVIPYLHEDWKQMEATVASIISFTPAELLDEVLFIDDGNTADWQFHDRLRAIHPKITVHRNSQRQGLIRSKIIGADLTKSPVLVFMEPHCIVSENWLEPLLQQMVAAGPSHNTVAMPTLDIIDEANFSTYIQAGQPIGGFGWNLQFDWFSHIEDRNKSWRAPEAYPTPAMSGGIFAIWRDFWEHTGKYDPAMREWGGEHIEMSLRVWRCGGRIAMVPCSRIGHRFRSSFPYTTHLEAVDTNLKRVVDVWLDDFKEDIYQAHGRYLAEIDGGNITERLELKNRLKCKSMTWYMDNVYPELKASSSVWMQNYAKAPAQGA